MPRPISIQKSHPCATFVRDLLELLGTTVREVAIGVDLEPAAVELPRVLAFVAHRNASSIHSWHLGGEAGDEGEEGAESDVMHGLSL